MRIFVEGLICFPILLDCAPNDTIYDLKIMIQKESRIPKELQRLSLYNLQLDDSRTLSEYNISSVHILKLVLSLRGRFNLASNVPASVPRLRISVTSRIEDNLDIKMTFICVPDTTIGSIQDRVSIDGERLHEQSTLSVRELEDKDSISFTMETIGDIGVFGVHDGSPGIDLLRNLYQRCELNNDNGSTNDQVANGTLVATVQQIVKQVRFDSQRYLSLPQLSAIVSEEVMEQTLCSSAESLISPVLSGEECEVLRSYLDTKYHDISNDLTTDFKFPLKLEQLVELIGQSAVSRMCGTMRGDFDEMVLRRSSAVGQCINFHLDHSLRTMQVALNDDNDYDGGRLVFALDNGTLCVPRRPLGSFTVHDNSIVHGVSELKSGVRYGLFFLKTQSQSRAVAYSSM
eukprot:gene5513-11109_t